MGVVVPARDEEELLPGCLASLRAAAAYADVPVDVVVALDACTDGSAEVVARAPGVRAVVLGARNVGAARRAGWAAVLHRSAVPAERLWLATTDADTRVPRHWLSGQLTSAAAGWDAVVGTVLVEDWSEHPSAARAAYERLYQAGDGHPHVHGANLGLTAAAYLAAGELAPLTRAEDVALVDALRAAGARIRGAGDLPVVTSARRRARAPGGFAAYLEGLSA